MKIEKVRYITREMVRACPNKVFLFGDNLERRGFGGQAKEMRGEPNTVGVVTKLSPSLSEAAYLTDEDYTFNCLIINKDIVKATKLAQQLGNIIVIPEDGIGTGLAFLPEKAPKTYSYLVKRLELLEST